MKHHISSLFRLAIVSLAAYPAFVLAVPATSPYNTDVTNSYVQDQTSQAMAQLNNILCYISAMAPAEMVNLGNYIALVDKKVCSPNDGGGIEGSSNSGANYEPAVVNATRANSASPMNVKVWIAQPQYGSNIKAYLSATQAPSTGDPYGRFRMDYIESGTTSSGKGFITSTDSGLSFYQEGTGNSGGNTYGETLQLQLNASTIAAGSGSLSNVRTFNSASQSDTFDFAYNSGYFLRTDGTTPQCFSRDPLQAAESVWSYGLYASDTGNRISRNSGFPIVYTDSVSQTKMNGYVGYWGLWTPTTVDTTKPVSRISYNGGTAAQANYTLLQTGGKLVKYSKVTTDLDGLDKVKFQFWPQVSVPGVGIPSNPTSLSTGTTYEVYWNKATGVFVISGQQDPSTYNIEPFPSPVDLSITNMQLAAPWGLYGWSQMLGGDFAISYTAMLTLSPTSTVVTHTQNVIYPTDFAALGGMKCINNCPTKADINLSNAPSSTASPYASSTIGWTGNVPGKALYSYGLDLATGNLMDTATTPAAVISLATSGNNAWGVRSGRLVAASDLALLDAAVAARSGTAGEYIQPDIDALTTYYQWQTGGNNWDQLAILSDVSGPVRFDAPLNVSFTVPANTSGNIPYGTFAGANVTLQYGGFGNLWGIPSTCIDITSNIACTFGMGGTLSQNQRWTPQFSIPAGSSVTVANTQGTVAAGTNYLVKALDKEVRLANVNVTNCSTLTVGGAVTLPALVGWQDPTTIVGAIPTFTSVPAPRVIQGVKMY
jgi:hypothetical protein